MDQKKETSEKKGVLARFFDKLDKKLAEKSRSSCGCCGGAEGKDKEKKCCS